jgi:hypothetical protein
MISIARLSGHFARQLFVDGRELVHHFSFLAKAMARIENLLLRIHLLPDPSIPRLGSSEAVAEYDLAVNSGIVGFHTTERMLMIVACGTQASTKTGLRNMKRLGKIARLRSSAENLGVSESTLLALRREFFSPSPYGKILIGRFDSKSLASSVSPESPRLVERICIAVSHRARLSASMSGASCPSQEGTASPNSPSIR